MNSISWSICRVCLESCEEGNFQSIFDSDQTDNNDNIKLFIKICDCSGILIIENDQFTNIICENCMKDLKIAYDFRKRCQNSDKKLRDSNIKLEDDHSDDAKHIKNEFIDLLKSIKSDSFTENTLENNVENSLDNIDDIDYKQSINSKKRKTKISNKTKKIDKESIEPISKVKRKYTKRDKNNPTSEKKVKEICQTKPKTGEKFPCEYCGHNYSDKITLRYHMRKHTNEMHYVCELCGTAFETNYKLTRHKMTHTGEKPYSCRFCDRTFLHSSNRNLHEKRLHTHIRNHQCEYCVKAFHTPCQLRKHIRVHTGEKPYICELCGTGFKAKSHLTAHMHSLVPCVVKMNLKNKIQTEK